MAMPERLLCIREPQGPPSVRDRSVNLHGDGRATVVACHSGETIGPGLMSKILRDVEIDQEFEEWL